MRAAPARCPDCDELRDDVRPVGFIETGSGPGRTRYACRGRVPRTPLDSEPVDGIDGTPPQAHSVNSVDTIPLRGPETPPSAPCPFPCRIRREKGRQ
ncbi:hypothetical protein WDH52_03660 [Streptomyces sp. TRM70308]|uniref:hypothetical protein n=1 Tax=Streptomyces sp. TRM70308 TaxID=3131932 RepID=UPI003D0627CB